MQRVWTEHTCPFSQFSLVKHSVSGMYGRQFLAKGRAHYGGWRFISMRGDRSPKVCNDPTAVMSILQSDHSSASTSADSSGSVASAVLPSVSASSSPVTDSKPAPTVPSKKRKEGGHSSKSDHEGSARAKSVRLINPP